MGARVTELIDRALALRTASAFDVVGSVLSRMARKEIDPQVKAYAILLRDSPAEFWEKFQNACARAEGPKVPWEYVERQQQMCEAISYFAKKKEEKDMKKAARKDKKKAAKKAAKAAKAAKKAAVPTKK